jgi:hypothetical protein
VYSDDDIDLGCVCAGICLLAVMQWRFAQQVARTSSDLVMAEECPPSNRSIDLVAPNALGSLGKVVVALCLSILVTSHPLRQQLLSAPAGRVRVLSVSEPVSEATEWFLVQWMRIHHLLAALAVGLERKLISKEVKTRGSITGQHT